MSMWKLSKKTKRDRIGPMVKTEVLFFMAVFSGILINNRCMCNNTFALVEKESNVGVNVNTVVTISAPATVGLHATEPTASGQFVSNDVSVTVGTNSTTGYTLTMNSKNNTNLTRNGGGGTVATLSSAIAQNSFPANRWGYSVDGGSNYNPLSTSPITIDSASTVTPSKTKTVRFGAKISSSQTAGTYTGVIVFSATENPQPKSSSEKSSKDSEPENAPANNPSNQSALASAAPNPSVASSSVGNVSPQSATSTDQSTDSSTPSDDSDLDLSESSKSSKSSKTSALGEIVSSSENTNAAIIATGAGLTVTAASFIVLFIAKRRKDEEEEAEEE